MTQTPTDILPPIADANRVAIVANPFSGSRGNKKRVALLVEELAHAGLIGQPMWGRTELADALKTPEFARDFRCIVVAGGDGTISRVINERPTVPIAVLPLGTENLFAQEFAYRDDPRRLARWIAAGRTRAVDLGVAGNRLFSCVASAGFDGDVIHRLHNWRTQNPEQLRRVKRSSYGTHVFRAARTYAFPIVELEADGQTHRGALAMIFNLPRYGLGLPLAPEARCDDGLLDWFICEKPGVLRLLQYATLLIAGQLHIRPDVHHGRSAVVKLSCDHPVPMQIDGEEAGFAPVELRAMPAAMRVIVQA
jgi:diacylglycerol kinase (ATP)